MWNYYIFYPMRDWEIFLDAKLRIFFCENLRDRTFEHPIVLGMRMCIDFLDFVIEWFCVKYVNLLTNTKC